MARAPLPRPVSQQDRYLHDIATSLRTLCGDNVTDLPGPGRRELREPDAGLTCACGRECKTPAGLAKHQTACDKAA